VTQQQAITNWRTPASLFQVDRAYRQGDFHRIYFGEILVVYADIDAKEKLE
jgi:hypothetical protein